MEFMTADSLTYHIDVVSKMIIQRPRMDIPIPFLFYPCTSSI